MEERPTKKRLGVFQAITQDRSSDIYSTESNIFAAPEFTPCVITNSIYSEPLSTLKCGFKCPEEVAPKSLCNTQNSGISITITCHGSKSVREVQKIHNLEQKITSGQFQRKSLMPNFALNRMQNTIYDSPMNSSGSCSSRSFILNNSTEESSREEAEERRKPKKRPLEEGEKKFYVIKLHAIANGEDIRTTVMVKNIPNKYTQKMLLQTINKKFSGTYDFLYLPIDFKVKYI